MANGEGDMEFMEYHGGEDQGVQGSFGRVNAMPFDEYIVGHFDISALGEGFIGDSEAGHVSQGTLKGALDRKSVV